MTRSQAVPDLQSLRFCLYLLQQKTVISIITLWRASRLRYCNCCRPTSLTRRSPCSLLVSFLLFFLALWGPSALYGSHPSSAQNVASQFTLHVIQAIIYAPSDNSRGPFESSPARRGPSTNGRHRILAIVSSISVGKLAVLERRGCLVCGVDSPHVVSSHSLIRSLDYCVGNHP